MTTQAKTQPKNANFDFDCTTKETIFENDSTQTGKPTFDYTYRKGTRIDLFNVWRKPEELEDCSRADIKRAYRLGRWY